jgi:predicted SAM-dependent methyltransferase
MITEKKINLACGNNKIEGYVGVDIVKTEVTDYIIDLERYPWDIESESVEDIICSHYIEHINHDTTIKDLVESFVISNTYDELRKNFLTRIDYIKEKIKHPFMPTDGLFKFMEEIYRILKPEGKIRIIAPYYASIRAIQDPTHVRSIGEVTFMYFNKDWRALNKLEHYTTTTCNFDFVYGYNMQQEFLNKHVEQRTYAMKHYWNVIDDIDVTLTKK